VATEHGGLRSRAVFQELPLDSSSLFGRSDLLFGRRIEALSGQESLEHVQAVQRLIAWRLVAGSFDGGIRVCVEALPVSSCPAVHIPGLPDTGGGSVHLREARLCERERNCHDVNVTRVDQDGQARLLLEELLVIQHHVVS